MACKWKVDAMQRHAKKGSVCVVLQASTSFEPQARASCQLCVCERVYMCTTLWQFHKPDFGLPPATPPAMTSRARRTSETEINNHLPCGADLLYSFKPVHVRVSYMDRLSRTGTELFDVDGHIMPRRTRLPLSRCVGDSLIWYVWEASRTKAPAGRAARTPVCS